MQKNVEFRKQRDFGEAINDTFLFAKQNLKPLLRTFFTFCGFFVVAGMLAMVVFKLRLNNLPGAGATVIRNGYPITRFEQLFSLEYILAMLFSLLSYTAMQVSIVSYIKLYVEKGNIKPANEELWGYVKYYFFRVFWSSILLLILLAIGFVFCGVPGIWLFPIVSLFYPVMVVENGSFEYSFSRMFKVIKDNWWTTAGIVLVIWVIVYATTLFITLPTTIVGMVNVFSGTNSKANLVFSIVTTILQYGCQIFMILPVICITFCYYSLVERKESPGLLDRIEHFGEQTTPVNKTAEEY